MYSRDFDKMLDNAFKMADEVTEVLFGKNSAFTPRPSLEVDETFQSRNLYRKRETDSTIYKLALAGVEKETIFLNVVDNDIVVDVREKKDGGKDRVIYLRHITLEPGDDKNNISSKYENGLLTITVNKLKKENDCTRIIVE